MTARTLIQNERAIGDAIARRDAQALARLTHPSFCYVGAHAAGMLRQNRIEWVASVQKIRTTSFVHTATDVQILTNCALVTVAAIWIGEHPGAPAQQRLIMSDTWIRSTPDAWRLVRRHASSVVAEAVATAAPPVQVVSI